MRKPRQKSIKPLSSLVPGTMFLATMLYSLPHHLAPQERGTQLQRSLILCATRDSGPAL